MSERIVELTYSQRIAWGECPVCKAHDGELCDPNVGIALGQNVLGQRPTDGVHLARLQQAPMRVRMVPA